MAVVVGALLVLGWEPEASDGSRMWMSEVIVGVIADFSWRIVQFWGKGSSDVCNSSLCEDYYEEQACILTRGLTGLITCQ